MIVDLLEKVARREDLTRVEMAQAVEAFMSSDCPEPQIAGLLMAIRVKGEAIDELVGAATALRARAVRLPLAERPQLDTCGTGGDGSRSLNLSTASALVAAAAGITVAKHGNRSVSSACGSADVLETLGVPIDLEPEAAALSIETNRFAFLLAPRYHPATRSIAGLRRALGVRTLFNLLGPMTNPADVRCQIIGVFHPSKAPLLAAALQGLGIERALVVSADTGMDEISPAGATLVIDVGPRGLAERRITAADFGLEPQPIESIRGGDPATNAAALTSVLRGDDHPARTAVLMNASAALVAAGAAGDFRDGTELARRTIASGAVADLLARLATGNRLPA